MITKSQIKELSGLCAKHSNNDIIVMAVPKTIKNNGENKDVIEFAVIHKATRKDARFIYRDQWSNLERTLKGAVDGLITKIHKEILEGKPNKIKNSL